MPSTYKAATYAAASCWLEDTKVTYAANPKSGKSCQRYAQYEKSKTVGEALALGSSSADLLFDYEHGYLTVAPPFRKAPLDIGNVRSLEDLTYTDMVILKFLAFVDPKKKATSERIMGQLSERLNRFRQIRRRLQRLEVANAYGMENADDLGDAKGFWECGETWARRSTADKEARDILAVIDAKGRKVTDHELLRVLRLWGFRLNETRKNVMRPGQTSILSDTLGLTTDRTGHTLKREETRLYVDFNKLVCRWLHDNLPEELKDSFWFTSININKNYAARLHRDSNNIGPSIIKAFGDFEEGRLNYWPEDDHGLHLEDVPKIARDKKTLDISTGTLLFDGSRAHAVDEFKGERYSVVFFSCARFWKAPAVLRKQLTEFGFRIPPRSAVPKMTSTLRPPQGYGKGSVGRSAALKKAARARMSLVKAGYAFWPLSEDRAKQQRERDAARYWASRPARKVNEEKDKTGAKSLSLGIRCDKHRHEGWHPNHCFLLGPELSVHRNLELKGFPNVVDAASALNGGEVSVPKAITRAGYCVTFSNRTKAYYVMYLEGKREKAMVAFGLNAAKRCKTGQAAAEGGA